ncbi:hypothetical protein F1C15_01020 [Frigoribacterium sp. NBH87]|uniref:hypothetical protein n=1 Tax=Frigoribacterium sp. NBH87 TaxID=2596916 RepID=UPI0016245C4E|nr:hypothetical protein [Frigoribacterium sp. NBH87]QNE42599.1 hypothetical protein F1C15_01020 [Frigoribacterium sp. NBH87]
MTAGSPSKQGAYEQERRPTSASWESTIAPERSLREPPPSRAAKEIKPQIRPTTTELLKVFKVSLMDVHGQPASFAETEQRLGLGLVTSPGRLCDLRGRQL